MAYTAIQQFLHQMSWDAYCVYVLGITLEYLSLDYQLTEPHRSPRYKINRGVRMLCGYNWYFRNFTRIHQCQPLGTLHHTFRLPLFPAGTEVWYRITAAQGQPVGGRRVSPVFHVMIPDCPTAPALISARLYRTAMLNVPNGVNMPIPFQAARWDHGGLWGGLGQPTRLIAPEDGLYNIGGDTVYTYRAGGVRYLFILLNGVTWITYDNTDHVPQASYPTGICHSTHYYLTAGEYVELGTRQTSGGVAQIAPRPNSSPEFWMTRIPGTP